MNISERGLDLIKEFEGFRAKPYRDAVGVPTIGYGNTFYTDGRKVAMTDPAIDEAQATELLKAVVKRFESAVSAAVRVPLSQGQFDALVSFAYNVGVGNLQKSTLLRLLNSGDYTGATGQFARWNRAGGQVLAGLTRRRAAEAKLFAGG